METQNQIPKKINEKIVKTYAEDMAEVIESNREGLVKKLIHEDELREAEKRSQSPENTKNKIFAFLGSLLILATFAIFGFVILKQREEIVTIKKPFTSIIFTNKNIFMEVSGLSKDQILNAINNLRSGLQSLKTGEVEGVYLTENKKVIGLHRFLTLTKSNLVLPGLLPGNTETVSDTFLMGFVKAETTDDFFILIKVRSMADIFGNLRSWENKMFSDLHDLFDITLNSSNGYLLTKDFKDGWVANKNARILEDQNSKTVMLYTFADDHSIIIANTDTATKAILGRVFSGTKTK